MYFWQINTTCQLYICFNNLTKMNKMNTRKIETFIPRIQERLKKECQQLKQAIINHVKKYSAIDADCVLTRVNQIDFYEHYIKSNVLPRLSLELAEYMGSNKPEDLAKMAHVEDFCFGGQKLIFKNDPDTWTPQIWGHMCFKPDIRPTSSLAIWHMCKANAIISINTRMIASQSIMDVKIWDMNCNFLLLATLPITGCIRVVPIDDSQVGTLDEYGLFRVWSLHTFECNHVVFLPKTLLEIDYIEGSKILIMNGSRVELWCWLTRTLLWSKNCPVDCPFILIPKLKMFLLARRQQPYGLETMCMVTGVVDKSIIPWLKSIDNIFALDHDRFLICNTFRLQKNSCWAIVNIQDRAIGPIHCMQSPCPDNCFLAGATSEYLVFYNSVGVFVYKWETMMWYSAMEGMTRGPQQVVCLPNKILILKDNRIFVKEFDNVNIECFFI